MKQRGFKLRYLPEKEVRPPELPIYEPILSKREWVFVFEANGSGGVVVEGSN